jgi:SEC-C motif-containing protein
MKCPCDPQKDYAICCEPFHKGEVADSPETLMRSRYSAFALKNIDYILRTTDPQTRWDFDRGANQEWADKAEFLKLEVLKASSEGNKGIVEFKAHYKTAEEPEVIHHEVSKFRRQGGIWYFRDGKVLQ